MKPSIARKNYYELLGLYPEASEIEIQCAFSDLSRIYDPESRFFADIIDEPITQEQVEIFEYIKIAAETLLDEDRRKEYDRLIMQQGDSGTSSGEGL